MTALKSFAVIAVVVTKKLDMKAHQKIVREHLDWDLVENRLDKYPAIGRYFNIRDFRSCSDKGPFYCHFLSWKLGVWKSGNLFRILNDLIEAVETIPNWSSEIRQWRNRDFTSFWPFLWQLQVANLINKFGDKDRTEWNKSGPDLRSVVDGQEFYIECTVPLRSHGIAEFIDELCQCLNPRLKLRHKLWCKFSLPQDMETDEFLNELFTPFLEADFLQNKLDNAEEHYPLLLDVPQKAEGLQFYVEGTDVNAYQPGILSNKVGFEEKYIKDHIEKAFSNKCKSPQMNSHPNMLAINFLLGIDFQMAIRDDLLDKCNVEKEHQGNIDAIMYSVTGINELFPRKDKAWFKLKASDHPFRNIFYRWKNDDSGDTSETR